jgi:hypothetical protein
VPEAGRLTLDTYLAWGDAYTSGFRNTQWDPASLQGLYPEAQAVAYPTLLAGQLALASELTFTQHLTVGNGSGYVALLSVASPHCSGQISRLSKELRTATPGWNEPSALPVINNLSVPHLRLASVSTDSLSLVNPFAGRLHLEGSYVNQMATRPYTFATLWLGMEDLLNQAMTGAANVGYPALPNERFVQQYAEVFAALARNNQTPYVLVGNLPDITRFPFFSTVSHRYRSIENCNRDPEPVYIRRGGSTDGTVAGPRDQILLSANERIGNNNGLTGLLGLHPDNPLPNALVLDEQERTAIQQAIRRHNASLDSLVAVHNQQTGYQQVVVVNLWQTFEQVAQGMTTDGLTVSQDYLGGGIFAIDGLYFTPRGHALVANAFVETINQTDEWEASIPPLTLTDFSGIVFP